MKKLETSGALSLYTHTHGISLIVTIITIVIIITGSINTVYANVQSRAGTTITRTTPNEQFINIRNMEAENGVLGLNATIDADGNESTSNNIDSHLAKQTELGIVITFINSQYGVKYGSISFRSKETNNDYTTNHSSTKNMSGIFGIGSYHSATYEYQEGHPIIAAAGGPKNTIINSNADKFRTVKNRYINIYDLSTDKKNGDAKEYLTLIYFQNDLFYLRTNSELCAITSGRMPYQAYAVIVNGTGV